LLTERAQLLRGTPEVILHEGIYDRVPYGAVTIQARVVE
jgi:hypothetical protein